MLCVVVAQIGPVKNFEIKKNEFISSTYLYKKIREIATEFISRNLKKN